MLESIDSETLTVADKLHKPVADWLKKLPHRNAALNLLEFPIGY